MNSYSSLIYISLIPRDDEHFSCLLIDCISSSVKYLFSSLAHLLTGLFGFFGVKFFEFFIYPGD